METNLRKYRLQSGVTQEWLASRLSVTKTTVSRWESGKRRIPAERVVDIARLVDAPPGALRPDIYPVEAPAE